MPNATLFLAELGKPLFGSQWLALLLVLGLIALLLVAVAVVGRILAATHPETQPKIKHVPGLLDVNVNEGKPLATHAPSMELMAIITAAVAATYGRRAHIVAVQTLHAPSVETLMQQWSMEGRRQIYSSHTLR